MARYDHLPIFRAAYDLTVHNEKIVRNFGRYHKVTLGTGLRNRSRAILQRIIRRNNPRDDRAARLLELRQEIESLKVLPGFCQQAGVERLQCFSCKVTANGTREKGRSSGAAYGWTTRAEWCIPSPGRWCKKAYRWLNA